jgi:signal transduction histidine kinase
MLSITNSLMLMTALFNAVLALFIIRGNWKNPTNVLLGIYLGVLSVWAIALIGTQVSSFYNLWLYATKITYIAGLFIAATFYLFSLAFPEDIKPRRATLVFVYGIATLYAGSILLSPSFLVEKIVTYGWGNAAVLNLYGYIGFTALFCSLYIGGLVRIWVKYAHAEKIAKTRLLVIGLGVSVTGISGFYFDILLASPFINNFQYIWTGPLLNTAMAILLTYSVLRLRLFNSKIIIAELVIALLWIFTFLRTLLASDPYEQVLNAGLFGFSLIIGSLLIRSVQKEVASRERIERQERELELVNYQQNNLLHFMSHEIKGYLTKSEAGFAAITQGDFGTVSPALQIMADTALTDIRKGVRTVMDILDAANLKRGTVSYKKEVFDVKDTVLRILEHLKPAIEEKHLTVELSIAWEVPCKVQGDEEKIREHVVRNLIDNAIKYTPSGTIRIAVARSGARIRFSIQDSGVGITPEDMQRLFTEGGHGKDSIKVNVHSTGYGLFIAKTIIDAHGGTIWAESNGSGSGSQFFVELPAA